jgi:hypothetical protein
MSLSKVVARRAFLVQKIAEQRNDITSLTESLIYPANCFDKGYALVKNVMQKPQWLIGVALLSGMIFRKRLPTLRFGIPLLKIAQWWFFRK